MKISPLVTSDPHQILQGRSAGEYHQYLQVNTSKRVSMSAVKVKIWQIFFIYKLESVCLVNEEIFNVCCQSKNMADFLFTMLLFVL